MKKREEFSNQRRIAVQKSRASLPPPTTHSPKSEARIEPARSESVGAKPDDTSSQMEESLDDSSSEPIEKQITHFTGMDMTILSRVVFTLHDKPWFFLH